MQSNYHIYLYIFYFTITILIQYIAMCPKGDDPITINQNHRQILLTVNGPQSQLQFSGLLGLVFFGEISVLDIYNPSSTDCILKLQSSSYFGTVDCTYTYISANRIQFLITFLQIYFKLDGFFDFILSIEIKISR